MNASEAGSCECNNKRLPDLETLDCSIQLVKKMVMSCKETLDWEKRKWVKGKVPPRTDRVLKFYPIHVAAGEWVCTYGEVFN